MSDSPNAARKSVPWTFAMIALVFIACCRTTFADDPASTTAGTAAPPDKSSFNLLNPTPKANMRDLDTDRPSKTNSPHTIDAGHLQIEFGLFDYLYNRDRYHGANARTDALGIAQFNFRLGVLNNLELNAVVNPYQFARNTDDTTHRSTRQSTFGDTTVGGSVNLWGNDNNSGVWDSALGVQTQFKIPTARESIGNGHPELLVGLPMTVNLPADFHLAMETSVTWERNVTNSGYVTGWQNSAVIDHAIFEKLDVYLEYWSHVSTERHQEAQQTLDAGALYQLSENLVLDTGVNVGLNHASPSIEWLAGASVRF